MRDDVERKVRSNQLAASARRVVGAQADWRLAGKAIMRCGPVPSFGRKRSPTFLRLIFVTAEHNMNKSRPSPGSPVLSMLSKAVWSRTGTSRP